MRLLVPALFFLLAATPGGAQTATYALTPEDNIRFLNDYAAKQGVKSLPDGVMYRVVQAGNGHGTSPISRIDIVSVEYKGWTIDGHVFDATKGEPRSFVTGNLIAGWGEVLYKMKTGDEWQVVIPASKAYGNEGRGTLIPPDQTLVFLIKLEEVQYP